MQTKIIPAKDIVQLHKNLGVSYGLSKENLEFYVPIYEEKTKELEALFGKFADGRKTVYLLGQSGSGKSTVLDYLRFKSPILKDKYFYVAIRFDDPDEGCDFDDPDFDMIEIYLTIFGAVLSQTMNFIEKSYIDSLLEKLKKLEESKDIYDKTTEQRSWSFVGILTELVASVGFGSLGIKWQLDTSKKEIIRKSYKTKTTEFLALLNDLLSKADEQSQAKNGKQLFLIMDGLEKIKDSSVLQKIFTVNSISNLRNLYCKKIIVCPVHLPSFINSAFFANDEVLINLKIYVNPRTQTSSSIAKTNRNLMKQVIEKRIDPSLSINQFFDEEALTTAIHYSGGFQHDYFKILADGIIKADIDGSNGIVRKDHIEQVVSDIEFNRAGTFSFSQEASRLLYEIYKNNTITNEQDQAFVRQVLLNNIIIIKNDERWHKIHPLIEKTVRTYGENTEKTIGGTRS